MEATILSPESTNNLSSPVAGGGKAQPERGSALPFSTILQSQQQPKGSPFATNAGSQSQHLFAGTANELSLNQHSLGSAENTEVAPWLLIEAQSESARRLSMASLSEDDSAALLNSVTDLQEISDQINPLDANGIFPSAFDQSVVGLSNAESRQSLAGLSDFAQSAQQGLLRAESSSGGGGAGNMPLFDPLGAEGNTFAVPRSAQNTTLISESQSGVELMSVQSSSSDLDTASITGAEFDALEQPATFAETKLRESTRIEGQRALEQPATFAETKLRESTRIEGQRALEQPATFAETKLREPTRIEAQRAMVSSFDAMQTDSAGEVNTARELTQNTSGPTTELNAARSAEQISQTALGAATNGQQITSDRELSAPNANNLSATSDLSAAEIESPIAPSLTAIKNSAASSEPALVRDASPGSSSQNDGAIELSEAEILAENSVLSAPLAQQNKASSASAGLGAAVVDPLNSQVRSVVPSQAKRATTSERVDVSTAADGGEGYHWLSEPAEQVAGVNAEATSGNPMDADGGAVLATNTTGTTANNARSEVAAVDSFAAVKRTVDVAPSNDAASELSQSEATNLEIDTPVQDAQWSQALAYRVQFMAQQGIQRADVQLNPVELGPMEITIDVVDDVASVQITAENAATRQAVEQAVPSLRELMAQSGFGETSVELNSGNEEFASFDAHAQLLNQFGTDQGNERGGRESRGTADTANPAGVKTLGGNEIPQRTSDGRLSFYV